MRKLVLAFLAVSATAQAGWFDELKKAKEILKEVKAYECIANYHHSDSSSVFGTSTHTSTIKFKANSLAEACMTAKDGNQSDTFMSVSSTNLTSLSCSDALLRTKIVDLNTCEEKVD